MLRAASMSALGHLLTSEQRVRASEMRLKSDMSATALATRFTTHRGLACNARAQHSRHSREVLCAGRLLRGRCAPIGAKDQRQNKKTEP